MSNAKLSQGAAYCRATLYPLDIGQIVAVSLLPSLCHIHPLKCGNMEKQNIEELEPYTPDDEYVEYQNDMQSQVQKDLEEASA